MEPQENWVGTPIEDAYVMLNLDLGRYVSLNCAATDATSTPVPS
jgi:hypothetical protein